MRIGNAIIKAAGDLDLRSVADIHTLSSAASSVCDEDGHTQADPRRIAKQLGYGLTTVYRSLARLEELGYIEWIRSTNRKEGFGGTIRIIPADLPDLNT